MGFVVEGCRRAVYNNPNSVEAAMEWVMTHMSDAGRFADYITPFVC
jgi:uncharacterized UBP type Zn finger protein